MCLLKKLFMKNYLMLNVLAVVVAVASLSFATVTTDQPGITASVKRGEAVFTQYCMACHQANGSGVPNLFPPLIKTRYVLGDKKNLIPIVLKGLTGEITVGDATYNGVMPPHNFLTDQQIADVLTYVRNSFGNKAAAVTVPEVKALRAKLKA